MIIRFNGQRAHFMVVRDKYHSRLQNCNFVLGSLRKSQSSIRIKLVIMELALRGEGGRDSAIAKKRVYRCFRCGQQVFFFVDRVDSKTGKKVRCNKDKTKHACYIGSTKLRRDKRWFFGSV